MLELPNLFYDTSYSLTELKNNTPYRNIGDMLVSRCPSVKNALLLCGTESRVVDGDGSDYERFYALCHSMPDLAGHPVYDGINYIIFNVFGTDAAMTPYNVDEMWQLLNNRIEELSLTPVSLLKSLNTESICVRYNCADAFPSFDNCEIDIYPITDLMDILNAVKKNGFTNITSFLKSISNENALRLKLNRQYKYCRNSKKLELDNIFSNVRDCKEETEENINALTTYIAYNAAGICSKNDLNLIIECNCDGDELEKLFAYIKLNKCFPQSVILITDNVKSISRTVLNHTFRNKYGAPSIVIVNGDYVKLSKFFPIGNTLEYQDNITDAVCVASVIYNRTKIEEYFGTEIAENMTFMNVKNRMKI